MKKIFALFIVFLFLMSIMPVAFAEDDDFDDVDGDLDDDTDEDLEDPKKPPTENNPNLPSIDILP